MMSQAPREEHRAISFLLAVAIHGLIAALLYFGVQWHTKVSPPMQVELWTGALAPAPVPPAPEETRPVTHLAPVATPEPVEPRPDIAEVKPSPRHVEKKPAVTPKPSPDTPKPRPTPKLAATPLPTLPPTARRLSGHGKLASTKSGLLLESPKDSTASLNAMALRMQAREAASHASQVDSAQRAYFALVRERVKSNVHGLDALQGNPEAIFAVTLSKSMTVLNATLTKSSGVPEFDAAIKVAIERTTYPDLPASLQFDTYRNHNLHYTLHDN